MTLTLFNSFVKSLGFGVGVGVSVGVDVDGVGVYSLTSLSLTLTSFLTSFAFRFGNDFWLTDLFDFKIVNIVVLSEGHSALGECEDIIEPAIILLRIIMLDGISITPGVIAIFNTTFVSLIAALILVIVTVGSDCTMVSLAS